MSIYVQTIRPGFVAEIGGIDTSRPLATEVMAALWDAIDALRMADPEQNVVVASPREPFATEGGNNFIESQLIAENGISAVPFVSS